MISFTACQNCDASVIDIFLIVDSSGSIGAANFTLAKSAIAEMISQLNIIGPKKIKVGVINYSTDVKVVTSLVDTDQDKAKILANVNNMQYLNGMTATGDAFQMARQIFFNYPRENFPRAVVLFTDGQSNTGANIINEANLLKQQAIVIFTVGIGASVSHAELDAISSIPTYIHKIIIENYQKLYAAINEITKKVCKTPAFIIPDKK